MAWAPARRWWAWIAAPNTSQLFALGYNTVGTQAQLYTLNPTTGALTTVGTALTLSLGTNPARIGFDFNPTVDRTRLTGFNNSNFRLNLNNGALAATDCDVFGRMRAEQFIGRVSDGIGSFIGPFRDTVVEHAESPPAQVGGAVLEYRIAQLAWPRAGDRVEIRSGLVGTTGAAMRVVHWMLDPTTGRPWGTSEAVAIAFDLDARKVVAISDAARAALGEKSVEGLAL